MTAAPLATLRKRRYGLDALPDVIRVPALSPLRPSAFEVRIEEATLDELAFAADAAEAEFDRISERYHALRRLYRYARQAGARGADRAVEAAITGAK